MIRIRLTPKEIFNTIVILIIGMIVLMSTIWLVGVTHFYEGTAEGFMNNKRPMIIISESMEPEIMTNGLVTVERDPYEEVEVGDIIVIGTAQHGLVAHRVHHKNGTDIITKGDNNPSEDPWIVKEVAYKGKVQEINNDVAPIITLIFGEGFKKGDIVRVYAGFLAIALAISFTIVIIYYTYDFMVTNYFLNKAYKRGEIKIYCEWMGLRIEQEELEAQIRGVIESKGPKKIKERYKLLRMYQILEKEAKYVKKQNRRMRWSR